MDYAIAVVINILYYAQVKCIQGAMKPLPNRREIKNILVNVVCTLTLTCAAPIAVLLLHLPSIACSPLSLMVGWFGKCLQVVSAALGELK